MRAVDERALRSCFVNASRGEATRLRLPGDLAERRWDDLDFLGWVDDRSPLHAYLVVADEEDRLLGVQLRRAPSGVGPRRARMCSLCLTTHPGQGAALLVAPRAGRSGRAGNTVGIDACADLACSAYARGLRPLPALMRVPETLTVEERAARLRRNLLAFVDRVRAPG
ncbi:FBP domain-containing protein [Nocardioides sp. zg-579]|uniref:FBP domain-containing protein n=1 Tax=Nocardioides marmotae TaxID=2663857 RepID=A0A6I3J2R0_9ACTN|nr:FBP domain-containing protein [Nocardioides marmotae]MCR6031157.1 FBP domain-containing protein [Gordonia jinghuaiqii]MTB94796.1 FBP domain-containing protein [Nocardioides marmotae]QKE01212.1 FBP domain-containing protein [Nocardioides marmotae]